MLYSLYELIERGADLKKIKVSVINKLIAATALLFFLSSILAIMVEGEQRNVFHATYQQLLNDVNQINQRESDDDSVDNNIEKNEKNGLETFLTAYYDGYIEKDTYHVETFGKAYYDVYYGNSRVVTIKVYVYTKMIKFEDGSAVYELISYEEGDEYGRTVAQYIHYDEFKETIHRRDTKDVVKHDNRLTANYNDSEGWLMQEADDFIKEIGVLPGESVFNFSESNLTETYYREDAAGYHDIKFDADPRSAAQDYRKVIGFFSNSSNTPTVTQLGVRTRVDEEGMLDILKLDEAYRLTLKFPTAAALRDFLGKGASSMVGRIFSPELRIEVESSIEYNFIQLGGNIEYQTS